MTFGWLPGLLALAVIAAAISLAPLLFRRRRTRSLARSGARLRCHFLPNGRRLPQQELKSLPAFEDVQTAMLTNVLHRRDIDVAIYLCDWKKQTIALLRFDTVTFQTFAIGPSIERETEPFKPELIHFLERQVQPLSISASGPWLMVYREDRLVRPQELSTFLGEVHTIASMIKRPY